LPTGEFTLASFDCGDRGDSLWQRVRAVISHLLSSRRADKEHRLAKLEEVVASMQKSTVNEDKTIHYYMETANGHLTWTEAVKLSDTFLQEASPFKRLAVAICSIYFDDSAQICRRTVIANSGVSVRLAKNYKDSFPSGGYAIVPAFRSELEAARAALHAAQQEFEQKVLETAKRISRGRLLDWLKEILNR
jgi:hypothetical protein